MQAQRRARRAWAVMLACAILCGGGLAPLARAAEDPIAVRVEKLAAEASSAYRAADYQRAVELLEKAYSLRQVGALLYNLAKAYEKLGDQDSALDHYRRYVDSSDADPKLRPKAEVRIASLEEAHRTRKVPRADPDAPENFPVVKEPPPKVLEETAQERETRLWNAHRQRDRKLGLGLMGTGVGLALAGSGLWVAAYLNNKDFNSGVGLDFQKRAERDHGQLEAVIGDSLWGAAAVAAAVGSYFVWRGYHPAEAPRVTAAPIVAPTMAGLSLRGIF